MFVIKTGLQFLYLVYCTLWQAVFVKLGITILAWPKSGSKIANSGNSQQIDENVGMEISLPPFLHSPSLPILNWLCMI